MNTLVGNITQLTFTLDEHFYEEFEGRKPDFGPLGEVTYLRTYSRMTESGSKEAFPETLRRVIEGTFSIQKNHCAIYRLPWSEAKAQRTSQKMFKSVWDFKFLPPGRGLWMMGSKILPKIAGAGLNNCAYVSTKDLNLDSIKPFKFLMDMSMLGVGVGFDTEGAKVGLHVYKPEGSLHAFNIPDSREGWVESLCLLLDSYFSPCRPVVNFNYQDIRKAGEPIRGFGGTSSGHEPLFEMHGSIRLVLNRRANDTLTSSDIVDLMNIIGKCVVSGNVRRSSEMALGDAQDLEFSKLKADKELLLKWRWASNNSIICGKNEDYSSHAVNTAKNGEPGYFWLETARAYGRLKDLPDYRDIKVSGTNPCSEQSLESWELCCLVETFPARHANLQEYYDTLKLAYLYAKTVTLVPTHWPETNAVMLRNRRIGCSQSGITRAFARHGRRQMFEWCDKGYSYICGLDKQYSAWLCVPESIKKTSVKPSGSVSLLPGEPPGIHYPHSKFYIRRMRIANNSDLVAALAEAEYPIEPDKSQPSTTLVVSFPVKEPWFSKSKSEVSMWEQLENVAQYQYYWADNQVSATITFKPEESKDIESALELYGSRLKSISFLPLQDHGYEQAPYEEITEEQYKALSQNLKPVNFSTEEEEEGSRYCDSEACVLSQGSGPC